MNEAGRGSSLLPGLPELTAKKRFSDADRRTFQPKSQVRGDSKAAGVSLPMSIDINQVGKGGKLLDGI
jgi:hypothetical protein